MSTFPLLPSATPTHHCHMWMLPSQPTTRPSTPLVSFIGSWLAWSYRSVLQKMKDKTSFSFAGHWYHSQATEAVLTGATLWSADALYSAARPAVGCDG